jgi:hypothetical protein
MTINLSFSIISIKNELYITAYDGLYKSDKSFNIVKSYIRSGARFTIIYYNSTSDILYAASQGLTNQPWALTEKNGKLYVGFTDGSIQVFENNLVVKNITTLCTSVISSIVIDTNESMGVLCCTNPGMLYIYSTNGSYTGKNLTTLSLPRFMNYDLSGHFIIAGESQINVFY